MKDYVHKEGCFTLFYRSKTKDTQPDMRGEGMLNGVPHEIAAWKKRGNKGEFLSLVIQPKRAIEKGSIPKPETKPPLRKTHDSISPPLPPEDDGSDVPF